MLNDPPAESSGERFRVLASGEKPATDVLLAIAPSPAARMRNATQVRIDVIEPTTKAAERHYDLDTERFGLGEILRRKINLAAQR